VNAELFPIALIVWSGAIRSGWCNFPSILVTVQRVQHSSKKDAVNVSSLQGSSVGCSIKLSSMQRSSRVQHNQIWCSVAQKGADWLTKVQR
jgi:hypothetical protein